MQKTKYKELTKRQWEKAISLRKKGATLTTLAELFNFPKERLSTGLKERGASTQNGLYEKRDLARPNYREIAAVRAYYEHTPLNVISDFWQINEKELKIARAKLLKYGMI